MNEAFSNDITVDRAVYVRELQRSLRTIQRAAQGYSTLPVDGIFGDETRLAVIQLQEKAGLPATGRVDLATWDAVMTASAAAAAKEASPARIYAYRLGQPPLAPGMREDAVYFLQIMLFRLCSIYTNLPAADAPSGFFSENTAGVLRALQRRFGLTESGIADKETWNKTVELYNQESL